MWCCLIAYRPTFRPEDYDGNNAFSTLYQPDHYRCKLPIYAAGSYQARVTTVYGDTQKSSTAKCIDAKGEPYEFQLYPEIVSVQAGNDMVAGPAVGAAHGLTEFIVRGSGFRYGRVEEPQGARSNLCNERIVCTYHLHTHTEPFHLAIPQKLPQKPPQYCDNNLTTTCTAPLSKTTRFLLETCPAP